MTLISIPENPPPRGGVVLRIGAADGVALRTARWIPRGTTRGTVTICQGRAEFIEKYFEVASELLAREFAVVAFDWRGQGGSDRQLRRRAKGHIRDFKLYQRDIAALEQQVLAPFAPKPWFGLGHSMGGAILIEAAHDGVLPFERMVLTGPMIDIAPATRPKGAELLAKGLTMVGLSGAYVPGGNATSIHAKPFAGNPLTSDETRHARAAAVLAAAPQLSIGAPTVGWVHAAFQLFARFRDPAFAPSITLPTFILACGDDALVDTLAIERFAARFKTARHVVLPPAKHELMMEKDALREQFWAAFDAFIPGRGDGVDEPVRGSRRNAA